MPEKERILVVDDNPRNLQLVGTLLRDAGYLVSAANSGTRALSIVEEALPDLILLDIMMPEIDGYQVFKELEARGITAGIPVIFITASNNPDDETKCLRIGAVDFITKPINPPVLLARVKTHLRLKETISELRRRGDTLAEMNRLQADVERITRHDLRSPLQIPLTLPPLLLRKGDNLTEEQKNHLHRIHESACRMLDLINNSLDLFKMETGRYILNLQPMRMRSLADAVVESLSSLMKRKALTCRCDVSSDPEVMGEDLLLYSALSNLLKNAIEASGNGEEIQVAIGQNGNTGFITLTNDGEVPQEVRHNFFEKYVTHGKRAGTGLGTYSAKLIVDTLGGEISVDTSKSGRTSVTIHLPLAGQA